MIVSYSFIILYPCDKQLDEQTKKRGLAHKLQGVTWQFVGAASQFQDLAKQVNAAEKVKEFQTASRAFSDAGKKFKIVGEVFLELVQNANCAKLAKKAEAFQTTAGSESGGFQYKANQIGAVTDDASADAKAAILAFNDAIGTFKISANLFNEFAQAIPNQGTNCPNLMQSLITKAESFKDTCDLFTIDASTFYKRAQLITGTNLGGNIHINFNTAAEKFGKVDTAKLTDITSANHGAAIALFNAIKKLAGQ